MTKKQRQALIALRRAMIEAVNVFNADTRTLAPGAVWATSPPQDEGTAPFPEEGAYVSVDVLVVDKKHRATSISFQLTELQP